MELQAFTVPVPVDRAWHALLDPPAHRPVHAWRQLRIRGERRLHGNVKIKLGLIKLSYRALLDVN